MLRPPALMSIPCAQERNWSRGAGVSVSTVRRCHFPDALVAAVPTSSNACTPLPQPNACAAPLSLMDRPAAHSRKGKRCASQACLAGIHGSWLASPAKLKLTLSWLAGLHPPVAWLLRCRLGPADRMAAAAVPQPRYANPEQARQTRTHHCDRLLLRSCPRPSNKKRLIAWSRQPCSSVGSTLAPQLCTLAVARNTSSGGSPIVMYVFVRQAVKACAFPLGCTCHSAERPVGAAKGPQV